MSFVTLPIFLLQITGFYCYGDGAPTGACVTMQPGHTGIVPQTSPTPYTITASSTTYRPNQEITVTVGGSQNSPGHGGLLVQARKIDGSSGTPIGTFMTPSMYTKVTQCTAAGDSWTHSAADLKANSTVIWRAPASYNDTIVFRATVATSISTYWLDHETAPLTFASTDTDNPDSSKNGENGLSDGAIAGISIAALVVLICVFIAIVLIIKKKKDKKINY